VILLDLRDFEPELQATNHTLLISARFVCDNDGYFIDFAELGA
jgi:hypothetical protein